MFFLLKEGDFIRTSKSISTVCYNTPEFLKKKLEELVDAQILAFWVFIQHKPEDDEKKSHIHLYCEPAKILQTEDFKDYFKEPDKKNPLLKPLTCISWRSSKFDDWYLYNLHDTRYLARKGQSRKYHYTKSEMIPSDSDDFDDHIHLIDMLAVTPYDVVIDAVNNGLSFQELVASGRVPIQQIRNFQLAYKALHSNLKRKNKTHTPKNIQPLAVVNGCSDEDFNILNSDTGEVIY